MKPTIQVRATRHCNHGIERVLFGYAHQPTRQFITMMISRARSLYEYCHLMDTFEIRPQLKASGVLSMKPKKYLIAMTNERSALLVDYNGERKTINVHMSCDRGLSKEVGDVAEKTIAYIEKSIKKSLTRTMTTLEYNKNSHLQVMLVAYKSIANPPFAYSQESITSLQCQIHAFMNHEIGNTIDCRYSSKPSLSDLEANIIQDDEFIDYVKKNYSNGRRTFGFDLAMDGKMDPLLVDALHGLITDTTDIAMNTILVTEFLFLLEKFDQTCHTLSPLHANEIVNSSVDIVTKIKEALSNTLAKEQARLIFIPVCMGEIWALYTIDIKNKLVIAIQNLESGLPLMVNHIAELLETIDPSGWHYKSMKPTVRGTQTNFNSVAYLLASAIYIAGRKNQIYNETEQTSIKAAVIRSICSGVFVGYTELEANKHLEGYTRNIIKELRFILELKTNSLLSPVANISPVNGATKKPGLSSRTDVARSKTFDTETKAITESVTVEHKPETNGDRTIGPDSQSLLSSENIDNCLNRQEKIHDTENQHKIDISSLKTADYKYIPEKIGGYIVSDVIKSVSSLIPDEEWVPNVIEAGMQSAKNIREFLDVNKEKIGNGRKRIDTLVNTHAQRERISDVFSVDRILAHKRTRYNTGRFYVRYKFKRGSSGFTYLYTRELFDLANKEELMLYCRIVFIFNNTLWRHLEKTIKSNAIDTHGIIDKKTRHAYRVLIGLQRKRVNLKYKNKIKKRARSVLV